MDAVSVVIRQLRNRQLELNNRKGESGGLCRIHDEASGLDSYGRAIDAGELW